ncbi:DUF6665 family protein [Telmatospirillum sp.]|uniref:DUF6665 family protein n=1 Tax=Telmatospirillum sp. TaxID=2079197 RepID=UPI00283EFC06|nr:DUF6665 family protein [Telmatospirillum sp.]MDR3438635.1 hypothetical protein [Telmatospirillum sp.]
MSPSTDWTWDDRQLLRMPRNPFNAAGGLDGSNILGMEILAEQAASLKQAGSAVEHKLRSLEAARPGDPTRPSLVIAAAEAVHAYLIQLELVGILTHGTYDSIIASLAIPREVMAKVGVRS